MINICNKINCSFSKSNGCSRYTLSNHCHLMDKSLPYHKQLQPNQYWLFAKDDVNSLSMKEYNEDFISTDESSQLRLAREN